MRHKKVVAIAKPKAKCCTSKPRCRRCPIRMFSEGTLPEGFRVKRRRLVKLSKSDRRAG
jgi:hypothetical protein